MNLPDFRRLLLLFLLTMSTGLVFSQLSREELKELKKRTAYYHVDKYYDKHEDLYRISTTLEFSEGLLTFSFAVRKENDRFVRGPITLDTYYRGGMHLDAYKVSFALGNTLKGDNPQLYNANFTDTNMIRTKIGDSLYVDHSHIELTCELYNFFDFAQQEVRPVDIRIYGTLGIKNASLNAFRLNKLLASFFSCFNALSDFKETD